jgi:hypothetical protein
MAKKKAKPRTNGTHRKPRKTTVPDWGPAFLGSLARTANIRAACVESGATRSAVYRRRDGDGAFAEAMAAAIEDATDGLEMEARRRAVEGRERPVFGSGGPGVGTVRVGSVVEYSDTLMVLLLKAHRPEKYRENHRVEHAGSVGVTVTAEELSDDELASIARRDAPAPG